MNQCLKPVSRAAVAALVFIALGMSWRTAAPEPDPAGGERIFQANCAMCHGRDATGMMGMHPALTGAVNRLTQEGVEVTIRNGRDTRPPMPAFADRLSDDEITSVIAYLDRLPDGPRNFGPEADASDDGMGGMMRGGETTTLWVVIVVLATGLAGTVGYITGQRARKR